MSKLVNKELLAYFKNSNTCHHDYLEIINENIKNNEYVVFGSSWCPWTQRAKDIIKSEYSITPIMILPDIVNRNYQLEMNKCLKYKTGSRSFPQVWIKGELVGGFGDLFDKIL